MKQLQCKLLYRPLMAALRMKTRDVSSPVILVLHELMHASLTANLPFISCDATKYVTT